MKIDHMHVEILADGTIKTTTDPISGASHQSAEEFLAYVARLAGGKTTREQRTDVQEHTHTHTHQHEEHQ